MGTMIQRLRLTEADYRGERFRDHPKDVKNNGELLSLTRPDVIRDIHEAYLAAGADIIETNTFGATRIAQDDYGLGDAGRRDEPGLGVASPATPPTSSPGPASRASSPAPSAPRRRPPASAPTSTTRARATSISRSCAPPITNRSRRWSQGGVDLLLVETIFDTLNAKAALFAIDEYFEQSGERLPLDHQRHRDRRLGPHPVRPDRHRLLVQRAPRAAAGGGPELRAGRGADASVHRRNWRARRRTRSSAATRTPACPTR